MAEYSEAFARFILECKAAYLDLCEQIDQGNVPAGQRAELNIAIPASVVDEIRFDRLAVIAKGNGHG